MSIWDNIKSFDSSKNTFKNWICAISKYKAIDYKKKYLSKIEYVDMSEEIYYIDEELLKSEMEEEINDILNDVKIDVDEYKEVKFDNNDEIKKRMKSKIKKRKSSYKKVIVAASLTVVLGGGILCNETVWANVQKMWYTLQSVLDLKSNEVTNYKYEINKSVASKNIKVTYKNLMIYDGNLIVEVDVDDSKFDPFKDFTEKEQKDWNVDKWGNRELYISLGNIETYVDGEKRGILNSGQADYEKKASNSNGLTNIVTIIPLNEIEGGPGVDKVGDKEFPYTINKDKIYNIKLNTKKIHIAAEKLGDEKAGYAGAIRSDWSIDLPIKGEDLIKATVNYDDYKINKNIKINIDGGDKKLKIDSLHLSPIYAKVQYTTDLDGYHIDDKYDINIKLENEDGEEYQIHQMTPKYNEEKNSCKVVIEYRNIFKGSKKSNLYQ